MRVLFINRDGSVVQNLLRLHLPPSRLLLYGRWYHFKEGGTFMGQQFAVYHEPK